MEELILQFLNKSERPLSTLQIAKGVHCETTKEVNPFLYKLLSINKVIKTCDVNNTKPKWAISINEKTQKDVNSNNDNEMSEQSTNTKAKGSTIEMKKQIASENELIFQDEKHDTEQQEKPSTLLLIDWENKANVMNKMFQISVWKKVRCLAFCAANSPFAQQNIHSAFEKIVVPCAFDNAADIAIIATAAQEYNNYSKICILSSDKLLCSTVSVLNALNAENKCSILFSLETVLELLK